MQTFKTIEEARATRESHEKRDKILCAIEIEKTDGETCIILSLNQYEGMKRYEEMRRLPKEIKRIKREVIDFLSENIQAREEKLNALFPGLKEIESAINAENLNRNSFKHMMDSGDCNYKSYAPPVSSDELRKKYPAAAAYLKAKSYINSSNVGMYSAGKKAIKRLESGEDYKIVIADMKKEWSEYTRAKVLED